MPFDYYSSQESAHDCAMWIAYVRLFCLTRTPACIYSVIRTPSTKRIHRNVGVVPVPDFVSNILAEFYNEVSAREAAICSAGKSSVTEADVYTATEGCVAAWATGDGLARGAEADDLVRGLMVESGVFPVRMRVSSRFKPGSVTGLRVTESTVIRLGASCVEACARAVGVEVKVMGDMLARVVSGLSQRDVVPAPLWLDEVNWLERQGYVWHGPLVLKEGLC